MSEIIFSTDKYNRKKPIKEFNLNQTMYSLVTNEAKNDLNLYATGFLGSNMTYKDLIKESDQLAASLKASGVKEGDAVAICTTSTPIVEECLLALSKIGAQMVWIDLRCKDKDIMTYINNYDCKTAIVFEKEDLVEMFQNFIDETNLQTVIISSPLDYLNPLISTLGTIKGKIEGKKMPSDKRFISFKEFLNRGKNTLVTPVSFEKERPSLVVQSSGSTGKPKQIVHTEYNFNSAVQKMAYTDLPFYKGEAMHISVPPFIIYGLGNSFYASLAFTMKAELNPYINAESVYNDLGKFDIALATPVHYRYIYDKLTQLKSDIEALEQDPKKHKELKQKMHELKRVLDGIKRAKVFVSGGDEIKAQELIDMQNEFDKVIVNGYGNNECLGAIVVSPRYANRPGSIGVPMHDVKIKIVNPETQETLSFNQVGELYAQSDNIFVEYHGNPESTKNIKIQDESGEWVKSGDLAYIDEDYFIYHKGRNRRVINKEAFKISPDNIEEVIDALPFVKKCVVVGVPDKVSKNVPMAFIVFNEGFNINDYLEEIKKYCFDNLPDYEIPSYFEEIEEIPYTPNEKMNIPLLEKLGRQIVEEQMGKSRVRNI